MGQQDKLSGVGICVCHQVVRVWYGSIAVLKGCIRIGEIGTNSSEFPFKIEIPLVNLLTLNFQNN